MSFGFVKFLDKKMRENRRHLGLVKKLLERQGMKVADHRDEEDPYIFVGNTGRDTAFDGVRVYKIGDIMAYRVQKREETHPYGRAYLLDLEEMYNDYMSDDMKEEEAVKHIVKAVTEEVKKFFQKSAEAEDEIRHEKDKVVGIRTGATDYSNVVSSGL